MVRRIFMGLLILSVAGAGMGFAGGTQEATAPDSITLQTFLEPGADSPRERAWGQIVERFEEETGISVGTNLMPWEQVDRQLILSVQAGNPPDVSFVRDKSFELHMQANSLMPLDEFIERDLSSDDIDDYITHETSGWYDGSKYTIRMHNTPVALYMRRDIMNEAGIDVPQTWDEFIDAAEAFTEFGVAGFAFAVSPDQPAALDYIQPMIEGFGGQVLDGDGAAAFHGEAGIRTFELLKSLRFDHGVTPQGIETMRYDDVTDAFAAGQVGMIIEGAHRFDRIAGALGRENIHLARIPGPTADAPSPTSISGWTLGIPRNSPNPEAAWELIKFATGVEGQTIHTIEGGQLPERASVLNDPHFDSPEGEVIGWFVDYMNEHGVLAVNPADFAELSELISISLQEAVSSVDSDVGRILEAAAREYDSLGD